MRRDPLLRELAPEPLVERRVDREREVEGELEVEREPEDVREPEDAWDLDVEDPLPLTPEAAPRTAPYTTSPAFIAPASPYTAPCRIRFRARGETAAAVAATATPISLSIKSSIASVPPGLVVRILGHAYPWAG